MREQLFFEGNFLRRLQKLNIFLTKIKLPSISQTFLQLYQSFELILSKSQVLEYFLSYYLLPAKIDPIMQPSFAMDIDSPYHKLNIEHHHLCCAH